MPGLAAIVVTTALALVAAGCAQSPTREAGPDVERPAPVYPFDPSPDDRAGLDIAGFSGFEPAPAGSGFDRGLRFSGIVPGGALGLAGVRDGDLVVEFGGVVFPSEAGDPLALLLGRLDALRPGERTTVTYIRDDAGPVQVEVTLGRRPPRFDRMRTEAGWFHAPVADAWRRAWLESVLALGPGRGARDDARARNRKAFANRDRLRLRQTVQAHFDLAAHEAMARALTDTVAADPFRALEIAAPGPPSPSWPRGVLAAEPGLPSEPGSPAAGPRIDGALAGLGLDGLVPILVRVLERAAAGVVAARAAWPDDAPDALLGDLDALRLRLTSGPYVHGDPHPDRERRSRGLVRRLAQVDRDRLRDTVLALASDLAMLEPHLERAAREAAATGGDGLLYSRGTGLGAVEIWGAADQRHATRALFRLDLGGDDQYLDVGGRADPAHPVSVSVDLAGDDLYGATSIGAQGGGLGGIGILLDRAGDDRYVARQWSQGVGVAGFGLLRDTSGDDEYRILMIGQGVGFAGAGVLADDGGDDRYASARYAQGLGLAGGVGALVDARGDDRYACTGRDRSGYGEPGLFEGWGQGVGLGFRLVSSGGIGILHDRAGDDRYEAGNFSQGGGYHYGWGILRDDAGDDRYVGTRYAQGFAAHQAEGTFIEGAGNDHYRSVSNVANGVSWDQASVLFHDLAGDDVYETSGFSLGAAAHNGMVLFLDGAGDDVYPAVPCRAGPNDYHGGSSIAVAADLGGADRYGGAGGAHHGGRVTWKEDACYALDLPVGAGDPARYLPHEGND